LSAFEEVAGPASRHIHYGLTSSDVLDTSFAILLVEATELILKELSLLIDAAKVRVEEHRHTPMMGRTHGIHAEPITFGLVMASWYAELGRSHKRISTALEGLRYGKLSGAVGTSAHLAPKIEKAALDGLGLKVEPVATQVVPRDRHAELFSSFALLAGAIERFSVEVRHLQRTEVYEAEEPFKKGQKGSSAMPHKRNPILSENLTGLARLMRSWASASFENIALWHERDISHSSVERVIGPDATITAVFMLRRVRRLVEGLNVYPKNMQKNIDQMQGLVFSQPLLLLLAERGLERQAAYIIVQRNAMRVWTEGVSFKAALAADAELMKLVNEEELESCFDIRRHLSNVDEIIDRALASFSPT
jgi:adenylosuccinate lyase